jgi:broad-specificity NMP kinase
MSNLEQILANVPPIQKIYLPPKDSYIIIGKPGCGKSTLASKLADFTKGNLVNLETAVDNHISKSSDVNTVLLYVDFTKIEVRKNCEYWNIIQWNGQTNYG